MLRDEDDKTLSKSTWKPKSKNRFKLSISFGNFLFYYPLLRCTSIIQSIMIYILLEELSILEYTQILVMITYHMITHMIT